MQRELSRSAWRAATRRWAAGFSVLVMLVVGCVAGGATAGASARATTNTAGPLGAPKTSTAQDARYLTDVAEADSDLVTYVNRNGNVALRAMLADGLAFCGFLRRGGGIDNALVDVVVGARTDEKTTHLPLTVHTFNTLEALALIDLCPREQRLVPASVRTELRQLQSGLRASSPSTLTTPSS